MDADSNNWPELPFRNEVEGQSMLGAILLAHRAGDGAACLELVRQANENGIFLVPMLVEMVDSFGRDRYGDDWPTFVARLADAGSQPPPT